MKIKKLTAIGLACVLMVSAAGCGAGSSSEEGGTVTEGASAGGAEETAGEAAAEEEASVKSTSNGPAGVDWLSEGQPEGWTEADATETLTLHTSSAAYSLDSYAAASSGDGFASVGFLLFDKLLAHDSTTGEFTPWLAESYEIAEDGSTMSFVLRQDAWFSNGEQLTAADAVFSVNRVLKDTEHCADASAKPIRNYVESVEQTGDFEFVIHFKEPNPEFSYVLTGFPILCESAYEEMGYDAYFAKPIGSGPYVAEDIDFANTTATFQIRTDEHGWWGYDYVDSYTNVKTVNILYSPEATTRISSLRTGEADIIADVPTTDVASLEAEGYTIDVLPATTYVFLQFTCGAENLFSNRDLREAVSLCLDREAIVASLLNGYGYAATTNARPGELGYRDDIAYEYNVEKAKELVASSGYNGEEIDFIYTTTTVSIATELAQAMQSMMTEIGLNVNVIPLEAAVYDDTRNARDYDICIAGIQKSGNMWYKTAAEVIGTDRFNTGLDNTELMEIGQEIGRTMSQDKLDELLKEMAGIELSEFEPNIYIYFPTMLYAQGEYLTDVIWHSEHRPDVVFAKIRK